jgi:putative oxidoreductase
MIQFMKNLSMMGAMLFLIANGSGPMSVDSLLSRRATAPAEEWARPVQAT